MDRRQFLWGTSMAAVSAMTLFDRAMAREPEFVIADTTFGKIRGMQNRGIKVFKGVPYGASTTGANRFMPPADPDKWTAMCVTRCIMDTAHRKLHQEYHSPLHRARKVRH